MSLQASEFDDHFENVTNELGLPKDLIKAICTVESGLRANAINRNDAGENRHSIGLCQVQYTTALELGLKPNKACYGGIFPKCVLFDPYLNIQIAGLYLQKQFIRYKGNLKKTISAYNAGSYSRSNTEYVNKVLRRMK